MQSGAFETRTKYQGQKQKSQYITKSEANFEHKCAPVLCIHVSFFGNQQLAHCRVTVLGSFKQSGAFGSRTKYQKQTSKPKYKISYTF
jgi:hypothetical protein